MESDNNISCKVVLVGDAGVGKTSIITYFLSNVFSEEIPSTISATYNYKILEFKRYNKSLSLDIWDTAGQEIYRSMSKNFYVNAAIGILVYDIRRKDSFDSVKNYWYEQLKESGEENMIIGIAGNKSDLFEYEQVSEEEVKEFAKKVGAIFQLTSCKKGHGINELFRKCGEKYLKNNNYIEVNDKGKNVKLKLEKEKNKENKTEHNKKAKCC